MQIFFFIRALRCLARNHDPFQTSLLRLLFVIVCQTSSCTNTTQQVNKISHCTGMIYSGIEQFSPLSFVYSGSCFQQFYYIYL